MLELVADSKQALRLSDIAKTLELAPASAHNLLRRLTDAGYLERFGIERRYRVGHRTVQLCVRVLDGIDVVRVARPLIEELATRIREDVYLALPRPDGIAYTSKVDGSEGLRLDVALGMPRPLHCTAVGKLYLAMQSALWLTRYFETTTLERFTPATITQPALLRQAIEEIRKRGYALSNEETNVGVCSASVPIFDAHSRFEAAITVAVPIRRFQMHGEMFIAEVMTTARSVSALLGRPAEGAA